MSASDEDLYEGVDNIGDEDTPCNEEAKNSQNKTDNGLNLFEEYIITKETEKTAKTISDLKTELEKSEAELKLTKEKYENMKEDNLTLLRNISSLWKTSMAQLRDKEKRITTLQKEKEAIVFRRAMRQVSKDELDRVTSRIAAYHKDDFTDFLKILKGGQKEEEGVDKQQPFVRIPYKNDASIKEIVVGSRVSEKSHSAAQHLKRLQIGRNPSVSGIPSHISEKLGRKSCKQHFSGESCPNREKRSSTKDIVRNCNQEKQEIKYNYITDPSDKYNYNIVSKEDKAKLSKDNKALDKFSERKIKSIDNFNTSIDENHERRNKVLQSEAQTDINCIKERNDNEDKPKFTKESKTLDDKFSKRKTMKSIDNLNTLIDQNPKIKEVLQSEEETHVNSIKERKDPKEDNPLSFQEKNPLSFKEDNPLSKIQSSQKSCESDLEEGEIISDEVDYPDEGRNNLGTEKELREKSELQEAYVDQRTNNLYSQRISKASTLKPVNEKENKLMVTKGKHEGSSENDYPNLRRYCRTLSEKNDGRHQPSTKTRNVKGRTPSSRDKRKDDQSTSIPRNRSPKKIRKTGFSSPQKRGKIGSRSPRKVGKTRIRSPLKKERTVKKELQSKRYSDGEKYSSSHDRRSELDSHSKDIHHQRVSLNNNSKNVDNLVEDPRNRKPEECRQSVSRQPHCNTDTLRRMRREKREYEEGSRLKEEMRGGRSKRKETYIKDDTRHHSPMSTRKSRSTSSHQSRSSPSLHKEKLTDKDMQGNSKSEPLKSEIKSRYKAKDSLNESKHYSKRSSYYEKKEKKFSKERHSCEKRDNLYKSSKENSLERNDQFSKTSKCKRKEFSTPTNDENESEKLVTNCKTSEQEKELNKFTNQKVNLSSTFANFLTGKTTAITANIDMKMNHPLGSPVHDGRKCTSISTETIHHQSIETAILNPNSTQKATHQSNPYEIASQISKSPKTSSNAVSSSDSAENLMNSSVNTTERIVLEGGEDTLDRFIQKHEAHPVSHILQNDDSEMSLLKYIGGNHCEQNSEKETSSNIIAVSPPPFFIPFSKSKQITNGKVEEKVLLSEVEPKTGKEIKPHCEANFISRPDHLSPICSLIPKEGFTIPTPPASRLPYSLLTFQSMETPPKTLSNSSCSPIPVATPLDLTNDVTQASTPPPLSSTLKSSTPVIVFDLDRKPYFTRDNAPVLVQKKICRNSEGDSQVGAVFTSVPSSVSNPQNSNIVSNLCDNNQKDYGNINVPENIACNTLQSTTIITSNNLLQNSHTNFPNSSSNNSTTSKDLGKRKKVPFITISREVNKNGDLFSTDDHYGFASSYYKNLDEFENDWPSCSKTVVATHKSLTEKSSTQENSKSSTSASGSSTTDSSSSSSSSTSSSTCTTCSSSGNGSSSSSDSAGKDGSSSSQNSYKTSFENALPISPKKRKSENLPLKSQAKKCSPETNSSQDQTPHPLLINKRSPLKKSSAKQPSKKGARRIKPTPVARNAGEDSNFSQSKLSGPHYSGISISSNTELSKEFTPNSSFNLRFSSEEPQLSPSRQSNIIINNENVIDSSSSLRQSFKALLNDPILSDPNILCSSDLQTLECNSKDIENVKESFAIKKSSSYCDNPSSFSSGKGEGSMLSSKNYCGQEPTQNPIWPATPNISTNSIVSSTSRDATPMHVKIITPESVTVITKSSVKRPRSLTPSNCENVISVVYEGKEEQNDSDDSSQINKNTPIRRSPRLKRKPRDICNSIKETRKETTNSCPQGTQDTFGLNPLNEELKSSAKIVTDSSSVLNQVFIRRTVKKRRINLAASSTSGASVK